MRTNALVLSSAAFVSIGDSWVYLSSRIPSLIVAVGGEVNADTPIAIEVHTPRQALLP